MSSHVWAENGPQSDPGKYAVQLSPLHSSLARAAEAEVGGLNCEKSRLASDPPMEHAGESDKVHVWWRFLAGLLQSVYTADADSVLSSIGHPLKFGRSSIESECD